MRIMRIHNDGYKMKITLIVLLVLLPFTQSKACTCVGKDSIESSYQHSDLVIIGSVISVKTVKIWSDTTFANWSYNSEVDTLSFEEYTFNEEMYGIHLRDYTVVITSSFKGGDTGDTITVRTGTGHDDCGFPFIVGNEYLIYATDEYKTRYIEKKLSRSKKDLKGIYRTDSCSRTALLNKREDDVKYLKER